MVTRQQEELEQTPHDERLGKRARSGKRLVIHSISFSTEKKAEASRNCDRTELQMGEECQGEKVVDELFTRRQKRNFLKKNELGKRWHELEEMVRFQFEEEDTRKKSVFLRRNFLRKFHDKK